VLILSFHPLDSVVTSTSRKRFRRPVNRKQQARL